MIWVLVGILGIKNSELYSIGPSSKKIFVLLTWAIYFLGSQNDATIWEQSDLKRALDSWYLNLPEGTENVQFHILGDDIFPLSTRLMKPFGRNKQLTAAQKIFNYR